MSRNNETTTRFRVDISELKKAMQDARRQVANANSEFNAIASSMDDWRKSSEGLTAKLNQLRSNLDSQETVLREYENTLEEVRREYGENSNEALEYATRLNNQRAVVNRIRREISDYEVTLREVSAAEEVAARTGRDVSDVLSDTGDEAEEASEGFTVLKGAVATFVGNALTSLVSGLKDAVVGMISFGDEVDKAMNSFQASTGATAEEMIEFENTMKSIYNNNFGESFDDIANSMAEVKRIAGDIGADELEKMTTNALMLRDTFDFEVNESMRATKMLMDQYGLSGEEAYNLIAQGAQNGLNKNGDLLDVVNEYSVHYKNLGYTAEQFFNSLANGTDAGTFSVDKLGDAMKEFGIRVRDGSDTTAEAFELLGYDADEMFKKIEDGSFFAEGMVGALIDELGGMPDSIEKTTAGVGLFGTMWEDLGAEGIRALGDLNGEISLTQDALSQINDIKYDSVGEALQGIGRNFQTGVLIPIGEKLLPIIGEVAAKFQEWLNDPATQEGIKTFTDSVAKFVDDGLTAIKDGVQWYLDNKDTLISSLAAIGSALAVLGAAYFITNFSSIISSFKAWVTSTKLATAAQWLLNAAMSANPIGILLTVIGAVVAAIIAFIATNDDARAKFLEIWDNIKEKISEFVESIKVFFTETIPEFFQTLIDWVKTNWQSILLFLINPFAGLFKYFYDNNKKFKEFVDNAITYIKELPGKVWTWLQNTINKVSEWVVNMTAKAIEAGLSFVNRIIEYVSQLPVKIWTWFVNTVNKVVQFAVDLGIKAKEAGQELVNKLIEKAEELPEKIKAIGSDVISGLWNGINDKVSWLKDKISGFVGNVTDWLKEFFKIGSPSKLMAEEVGKWLPEGLAVGITDNAKSAISAMKDLAVDTVGGARTGLTTASTSLGGNVGGVVNNFTQVINSPKQLNRLEIYRQSKNLLGYAGGGA